ncbi:MAG: hypothetical protein KGD63_01755 [Candidatus Lokiarchaeota archaeon]|nr:hypothetical protein [Candidatus Lokiarchaeota archaeon]
MAKKKIVIKEEDIEDIPKGNVDEDGDELIDLFNEEDDLENDYEEDLSQISDDMLYDEEEDEESGPEVDDVEKMLRNMKCTPCPGSSSKIDCQVRKDFGCPPDKAKK